MAVYHIHNSLILPIHKMVPALLTAEDDSGALNLDPYNMQSTFENPYAT